jgi:hypothetical protein
MELDENELEEITAGTGMKYDEAKEAFEKTAAFKKFKEMKPETRKELQEIGEVTEKDLENYLGGIRIEGEEYNVNQR